MDWVKTVTDGGFKNRVSNYGVKTTRRVDIDPPQKTPFRIIDNDSLTYETFEKRLKCHPEPFTPCHPE